MKKRLLALLLAMSLCLCGAIAEEYDWTTEYTAYYLEYDEETVRDWSRSDYADQEGMLLYMHDGQTEVSVSMPLRSDAPTVDDLADMQVENVQMYGQLTQQPAREDWYAPWDATRAGLRLTYAYRFGRSDQDAEYAVAKYMAALNDDKYLMVEVLDRSGDLAGVTQRLEEGFLNRLAVKSFTVSGGSSAYLTGADEKDGQVYLTLQPYDVALNEDGDGYTVRTVGEPQVVRLHPEARILAPQDEFAGILGDVGNSAGEIRSFIDGYRHVNGTDCVFNLLISEDMVRWMTYSYLY